MLHLIHLMLIILRYKNVKMLVLFVFLFLKSEVLQYVDSSLFAAHDYSFTIAAVSTQGEVGEKQKDLLKQRRTS